MLDWLIVGGGVHGVHLAVRLLAEAGVSAEGLRIVDPAPRLLDRWRQCVANTGMTHLRSPAVHHLDVGPFALLEYAVRSRHAGAAELFTPPYNRPAVSLFEEHCQTVLERYALASLHVQARVEVVELSCDEATVRLSTGEVLLARQVLLATGASEQPRSPDALRPDGERIRHIFQPGFALEPEAWPGRVAVVGAGISGAQVALRLADGRRAVHLLSRHPLREHQFDSEPGWVGPKFMDGFSALKDLDKRRGIIDAARHVGSMPPDVHEPLLTAIGEGRIQLHLGPVQREPSEAGILLRSGDAQIEVDAVALATGFEAHRPGGALVDQLAEAYALPCADCGYPVVDSHLRWHPRVFVSGPLAELELGPVARNIVGARRAAERIVPVAARA